MPNFLRKEFLLGIGVGFILSAIIVWAFGPRQLTNEEIKARAAALGMVEQGVQKEVYTSGITPVPPQSKPAAVLPAQVPPAAVSPVNNPARKVTITVTSGMGSEDVARMLEQKGAIRNQHEFLQVLTRHKAHTRLQNGTFTITVGEDMDTIVKRLTGK